METDRRRMQTRTADARFETREEGGARRIEGYFAVFGSVYDMGDGIRETIDPHAFDRTLEGDVRALCNHDARLVLGRTGANTLRLRVDGRGLWGEIDVNERDTDAMNLYARVARGDVSQCSFGFDILHEDAQVQPDGGVLFILREVKLYEVSCVTFPAYRETEIEAREEREELIARRREQAEEIRRRQVQAWRERQKELITRWHSDS